MPPGFFRACKAAIRDLQILKFFKRQTGFFYDGVKRAFWNVFAGMIRDNRSSFCRRIVPEFVAPLCRTVKNKPRSFQFSQNFGGFHGVATMTGIFASILMW